MRDFEWPTGVHIKVLEPLMKYAIDYDDAPDLEVHLEFDAIMPPNPHPIGVAPFIKGTHLDQAGHVTGEMVLRGERIAIDCYSVRDRSWGPRPMGRPKRKPAAAPPTTRPRPGGIGYSFGVAGPRDAWLVYSVPSLDGDPVVVRLPAPRRRVRAHPPRRAPARSRRRRRVADPHGDRRGRRRRPARSPWSVKRRAGTGAATAATRCSAGDGTAPTDGARTSRTSRARCGPRLPRACRRCAAQRVSSMQPAIGPPPFATTATSGCARDLTRTAVAAQLHARFVQHPVAVHAAGRQLTAVGVERQLAVERDPRRALHERARFAVAAQTERLEPREREEREAVVELGDVDVGRARDRCGPTSRPRLPPTPSSGSRGACTSRPPPGAPPIASTRSGWFGQSAACVGGRDHERDRPVDRHVAVEQAERRRDRARARGSRPS